MATPDTPPEQPSRSENEWIRFYARIEKGNRILVPQAARAAGLIGPGDYVSVTLRKVQRPPGSPP